MHRALANLNGLDVDRLDDADQERIEEATALLESVFTRPGDSEAEDGQVES